MPLSGTATPVPKPVLLGPDEDMIESLVLYRIGLPGWEAQAIQMSANVTDFGGILLGSSVVVLVTKCTYFVAMVRGSTALS